MAQNVDELITRYANKASGVYREFLDGTAESRVTSTQNVVVVGQFEDGPVMRPVYCESPMVAHAIFGNRNTKLEAKGCFGMLMAEHVLEQGPIWIMNLKNIDQYKETVDVKKLAINASEQDAMVSEPIATVYDTTKFWKVDKMYGMHGMDNKPSLSFASVLQGKVTIVIEKFWSPDYNYTIATTKKYNDTFAGDNLNDSDFVNDYLIRVHVFKTDLLNAKLSVTGAIINGKVNLAKIEDLQSDVNAKYFATYTGTVGDVIDINGNNLSIVTKMNADVNASGVYVAINQDTIAMNGIDILAMQNISFDDSGAALPTGSAASRIGYAFNTELKPICIYSKDTARNTAYMFGTCPVSVGDVVANESRYCRVLAKQYINDLYVMPNDAILGSSQYPITPDGLPFDKNFAGMFIYPANSSKAGQQIEMSNTNGRWVANDVASSVWGSQTQYVISINYNDVSTNLVANASGDDAVSVRSALMLALANFGNPKGINFNVEVTDTETVRDIIISTSVLPVTFGSMSIPTITIGSSAVTMEADTVPTVAPIWYIDEYVAKPFGIGFTANDIIALAGMSGEINIAINGIAKEPVKFEAANSSPATVKTAMDAALLAFGTENGITFSTTVTNPDSDTTKLHVEITTTALPAGTGAFEINTVYMNNVSMVLQAVDGKYTTGSNLLTPTPYVITVNNVAKTVTCNGVTNNIDMNIVTNAYGDATKVFELTLSEQMDSKLTTGLPIDPTLTGTVYGTSTYVNIGTESTAVTPYCFVYLKPWYQDVTLATPYAIQGIVSLEKHYVNGTAARQKQILDRLNDNWCMMSFSDPTLFRCRYMVSTFKTYIEPNAMYQFAKLANEAKRFLVFIAAPFYYELRTSKNPDFHDLLGEFDMDYVAIGSNPDKPSTNAFYYVNDSDTARFVVATMNVEYNDGFTSKIVPSTGAIAKAYYSKLSGTKKVYDIVAGDMFPISAAGVVGPEFDPGTDDRAAMERMGTNVLQKLDGVIQVRSSKTVYQTVLSAYNYPESLEKCFYVSDGVEPVLAGKIFKYNTDDARLAVKKRADAVCDVMVADGAIASYENKCDIENNPISIRKNGILVLDTILYNNYGIRIAVHRTTIKDPEV